MRYQRKVGQVALDRLVENQLRASVAQRAPVLVQQIYQLLCYLSVDKKSTRLYNCYTANNLRIIPEITLTWWQVAHLSFCTHRWGQQYGSWSSTLPPAWLGTLFRIRTQNPAPNELPHLKNATTNNLVLFRIYGSVGCTLVSRRVSIDNANSALEQKNTHGAIFFQSNKLLK